jgi:hypothetical protein
MQGYARFLKRCRCIRDTKTFGSEKQAIYSKGIGIQD